MSRLRRFPRLTRLIALLALVAMLSPTLTGLIHRPATAISGLIHICSAGPARSGPKEMPQHKLPSCPVCQALHAIGGGLTPPEAPMLAAQPPASQIFLATETGLLLPPVIAPQARPRAPPVLV